MYFEYFRYVRSAIAREKQLKHWTREQKIQLIEQVNPTWEDLYLTLQEPIDQGKPPADPPTGMTDRKQQQSKEADSPRE